MAVGQPLSTSSRVPPSVLALACAAWLALIGASPYLVVRSRPETLWWRVGGIVYFAGHFLCHQRADRSFHAWGIQLPVCGRCVGLYAGAVLGAVVAAFASRRAAPPGEAGVWRSRLIAGALPTGVSLALELAGLWTQTPAVRSVAAVPLGLVVAWLVGRHAADVFRPVGVRV